jgi:CRISP-associated protein Cas1
MACPVNLDAQLMNEDALTAAALHVARRRGGSPPGGGGFVGQHLSPAACRAMAAQLASEVRDGTYEPSSPRVLWRHAGKFRRLQVATIPDCVVQTVLLRAMEPYLAQFFAPGNYAVRGAGALLAVNDVAVALEAAQSLKAAARQAHVVKADVADFFDTIPHAGLVSLVRQHFGGRRLNRLIRTTLRQGQSREGRGLAQGLPLSPLLANCYLTPVDRYFLRRATVFYARYVDDILIVVPGDAERALANLHELEQRVYRLGLRLNQAKTCVVPATEGVDFLGFKLRLGAHGVEVTPNERSVARLKQRLEVVPEDGNTSVNLHAAKAAWASYFGDLAPQAWAVGERLVADEEEARLLRRPVGGTPVELTGGTQ